MNQLAAAPETKRVLIVEDHSILTQSLALTFRLEGMEPHVAEDLTDAAVIADVRRLHPDLVLLDLYLGGGRDSLSMIPPLRALEIPVLVLTGSADEGLQGAALDAGAAAVLLKGDSLERLCAAIHDVIDGYVTMRPARRDELVALGRRRRRLQDRVNRLSKREAEVLVALADGHTAEMIAARQFVSLGTVRTHVRSILRKLEVNSQLAAVATARQAGWSTSQS
ncbi:MAG TPA: response regulator transcription factor [Acidimicrobiia bacterium]